MEILLNNIDSSVVKGIGYSGDKLTVKLAKRTYVYSKVPKKVAREFAWAESKGKFFNEFIKDQYDVQEAISN
jgi:hypothetical protein